MMKPSIRRLLLCAALAGLLPCPAPAASQSTITFLEVALDEETRQADDKLRRYLGQRTGAAFVSERPLEYSAVVNRLASWRPDRGYFEAVRDGTISLTSRIIGSDADDQRFWISFGDEEDLARRIAALIHTRMHRVRYVWPYRPERPTVVRDVGFSLPPGSPVRVRRVQWLDAQRNYFQQDAEFEARVASADFFKLELEPHFVAPAQAGFGFDPMSNISYRVVLLRPAAESISFRVLTGALVLLLVAAAVAAARARRRSAAA